MGFVEACSTLVLFGVAMPLKYVWDMPLAVTIVGMTHGFLFVALALMIARAVKRVPISPQLCIGGIFGAVMPFGPFVVDRWLKKLGSSVSES